MCSAGRLCLAVGQRGLAREDVEQVLPRVDLDTRCEGVASVTRSLPWSARSDRPTIERELSPPESRKIAQKVLPDAYRRSA
jgi:hypothetical protein